MSSLRISSTVDAGMPSAALAAVRRKPTLCRPFGFSVMNSSASRALRASRAGVRPSIPSLPLRLYNKAAKSAAIVVGPGSSGPGE